MSGIATTNVLTLHEATRNVFAISIEKRNKENLVLKETIDMMENSLNPSPFLMNTIMIQTQQYAIPTTSTSHGSIRALQLVNATNVILSVIYAKD